MTIAPRKAFSSLREALPTANGIASLPDATRTLRASPNSLCLDLFYPQGARKQNISCSKKRVEATGV
ncbi:MAG: hypothetical protein V7K62_19665 [Nostoc sp.]